jgi:ribonuclease G
MPTVDHIGVSRKIPSDEERQRLKRILQPTAPAFPAASSCPHRRRRPHRRRAARRHALPLQPLAGHAPEGRAKAAPLLIHHDLDVVQRILRDQLTTSFKTIWVDNEEFTKACCASCSASSRRWWAA